MDIDTLYNYDNINGTKHLIKEWNFHNEEI